MTLRDYVDQLDQRKHSGFQDDQDFISEMAAYTGESLGSELGEAIYEDLQEMPQVLTVNHHGIDTFAQSTQSNLLFSMRRRIDGKFAKTIPVLACGSVPLNNLTYPRGLLIYASNATDGKSQVCKLPLFPDSYKRKLVSVAGPLTGEMIARARARAKKLVDRGELGYPLESALNSVFDDFAQIGQEFSGYSKQATVVNHRFWKRLFKGRIHRPELVYIELEKIVCRLLEKDLFDSSTICHQLMFDPDMRRQLIDKLDGQQGCWQYSKLLRGISSSTNTDGPSRTDSAKGTIFFWGVDAKGRKIPLCILEKDNGTGIELRGLDDSDQLWTTPFTPADIVRGLQDGRLLPSIFTSYLLVSIARGVSCIGGYYQADYLPIMQNAVIEILSSHSAGMVDPINAEIPESDLYLSGMQAVGLKKDGHLLPVGPLEIIASGGLDAEQYEQIGEMTVLDSHIASLHDTITDVAPLDGDLGQAKRDVSQLVDDAIGSKIVTISMD